MNFLPHYLILNTDRECAPLALAMFSFASFISLRSIYFIKFCSHHGLQCIVAVARVESGLKRRSRGSLVSTIILSVCHPECVLAADLKLVPESRCW